MEYYLDQLNPEKFQRLVNIMLDQRFHEALRLTPLQGADGGKDGETAAENPNFEYQVSSQSDPNLPKSEIPVGRYVFQAKFHRTADKKISDARQIVINDFNEELRKNILSREGTEKVNYFFLITNVPASNEAMSKINLIQRNVKQVQRSLFVDVWWREKIIAFLDSNPQIWSSFKEIFPGGEPPLLGKVVNESDEILPRVIRLALSHQYEKDRKVKFRQVELEQDLDKLFVDINIDVSRIDPLLFSSITKEKFESEQREKMVVADESFFDPSTFEVSNDLSGINQLLNSHTDQTRKIILEGGPGQGKSTLTQMVAQIFRDKILNKNILQPNGRWEPPKVIYLPFRIELREFANWLIDHPNQSIEEFYISQIKYQSGGCELSVNDLHSIFSSIPILFIFDGLDEIGGDELRDSCIKKINEIIFRCENDLFCEFRVILTSRPPAIAGKRDSLPGFSSVPLDKMKEKRVNEYIDRWLSVQVKDVDESNRIRFSFGLHRDEPHVQALITNPMQLSVLLQFIRLKSDAFPSQRAKLYKEYFQLVIDRDVEKSPELRKFREIIEQIHEFLGYQIHSLTEIDKANRSLSRSDLLGLLQNWLKNCGKDPNLAQDFFKLGEERFCLIVAQKGEGNQAKYGFEIQPIQEYFAAGFLCNQINSVNVHVVFELLIHRPYWKEVALFLAGLRRPNEKADLVIRTKTLDSDNSFGWYQDGRALVIELIIEGAFSEVGHVFNLAVDYVFEILDTTTIPVQNEPENLVGNLINIILNDSSGYAKQSFIRTISNLKNMTDLFTITRIMMIAYKTLSTDEIVTFTQKVLSTEINMKPYLFLDLPYELINDSNKLIKFTNSIQKDNLEGYADSWFESALSKGYVYNLENLNTLHKELFEIFSICSVLVVQSKNIFLVSDSPLVVWRLIQYFQILTYFYNRQFEFDNSLIQLETIKEFVNNLPTIDYCNLDEPTKNIVSEIIELSKKLINALCLNKPLINDELRTLLQGLANHISKEGIIGWFICKWSSIFYKFLSTSMKFSDNELNQEYQILAGKLIESINQIYTIKTEKQKNTSLSSSPLNTYIRTNTYYMSFMESPKNIRLREGLEPISFAEYFVDHIIHKIDVPFEWTLYGYPKEIQFNLCCDLCANHITEFLEYIGSFPAWFTLLSADAIRAHNINRIIKVVKETSDAIVINGACSVLSHSNFENIASIETIKKLLQYSKSDDICNRIFVNGRSSLRPFTNSSRTKIASEVLNEPMAYNKKIVSVSAKFLVEKNRFPFTSLKSEEANFIS